MSEWRNFVKDVAQKQGIKYNEALKIASPLWKEHKSGKSGDTMTIQPIDEQNEQSAPEPKEKSVYDSSDHPYHKDFLHIRKRQKGKGIWGDIWNGISSVLKPAMAIIGGPIGALASTLVPTITPTGVNILGQNL